MEGLLRFRDLPSYCRVSDVKDLILQGVVRVYRQCTQGQGLILNTFEELEEPIISHIRPHCPNIYPIGPMHTHLKLKLAKKEVSSQSSNSIFETDKNCMTWLDSQPLKSVMYVSIGSVAVMTRDELMEFWYGLVNSKKRFLWVIRPDLYKEVEDGKNVPVELLEETKERGYVVGWAPQEEVLDHPAVHSRYVSEAWKIGLDMKDVSDRKVVEKWLKKREGPLKVKEGEIAVHSTSLKEKFKALERSHLLEKNEKLAAVSKAEVAERGLSQEMFQGIFVELEVLKKETNDNVLLGYSIIRRVVAQKFSGYNMIELDHLATKEAREREQPILAEFDEPIRVEP
ncbi:hypothetical protein FNV43_RR01177 [Rhamnella rubrinervis]|uniref:Uncharacterized protein n=1 Tax=Rhamnella rubrinervis TaxID=2594499 RepID=A0A8K0HS37_9ROSA|nr:hypothetical protein FNV43_RR01177 [Rhamnella rubrinervis]